MSAESVLPGYVQVDAFGPDEEYTDGEEEVSYVTLDLGNIEPTLLPSSTTYRLIGLDTPTPYLQLAGSIFKGRHDSLLGTELLFTEERDEQDRSKRSMTHVANTSQRIRFKEVQLTPKQQEVTPVTHSTVSEVSNVTYAKDDHISASGSRGLDVLTGRSAQSIPIKKRKRLSKKQGKEREVQEDPTTTGELSMEGLISMSNDDLMES